MLTVIIILAAIVTAVCLIRVGVDMSYCDGALRLSARVLAKKIEILPAAEKKPKAPKPEKAAEKKRKKLNFSLDELLQIARIALKALDRLRRRLAFDRLRIVFRAGSPDPYTTVVQYSTVCAAVNSMSPMFENVFRVREREISISTDFDSEKMYFEFDFSLGSRVGQLAGLALLAAFSMLRVYLKHKLSAARQERMAQNG